MFYYSTAGLSVAYKTAIQISVPGRYAGFAGGFYEEIGRCSSFFVFCSRRTFCSS